MTTDELITILLFLILAGAWILMSWLDIPRVPPTPLLFKRKGKKPEPEMEPINEDIPYQSRKNYYSVEPTHFRNENGTETLCGMPLDKGRVTTTAHPENWLNDGRTCQRCKERFKSPDLDNGGDEE